jgi:hypothetical protein
MSDLQPEEPMTFTALLGEAMEGVAESFNLPSAMEGELRTTPSSGGSEELPMTRKRRASFEERDRKSPCWNVFTMDDAPDGKARCLECKALLGIPTGSTTGLNKHIRERHKELWALVSVQPPAEPYRVPGSHNFEAMARKAAVFPGRDTKSHRLAQLALVVKEKLPFNICDQWYFQAYSYSCGKDATPYSRSTMTRDILSTPTAELPNVKKMLKEAGAKVSLTFDIWDSKYSGHFLAFTAHWLTQTFEPREVCLWFEEVPTSHPASLLQSHLDRMLDTFELDAADINTITSDNASENVAAMRHFGATRGWPLENFVRCCLHSWQLAVDMLLAHEEVERLVHKAGKQHTYINKRGTGRQAHWDGLCDMEPGLAHPRMSPWNATRWHSKLKLFQDILPNGPEKDDKWLEILQAFNNKYLDEHQKAKVAWTKEDFQAIRDVRRVMQPFYKAMLECEASTKPTLNKAAHYYEYILDELDPEFVPDWLQDTTRAMSKKLGDYYSLTGDIHDVATLLDPVLKLSLFAGPEQPGHRKYEDVKKKCVARLRPYFERPVPIQPAVNPTPPSSQNRRLRPEDPSRPGPMQAILAKRVTDGRAEMEARRSYAAERHNLRPVPEELERYLSDPLAEDRTCPLKWWKENQACYPTLAKAARDILAGQASSAACERLFSHGKQLVSPERAKLAPETVKACMLLFSWVDYMRFGWK